MVTGTGKPDVHVLFDGTLDGFMSVIYACYYEKIEPASIQSELRAQLALGDEPYFIETDRKRAAHVLAAIRQKISQEAASTVFYAFLSEDDERFMMLMRYIRLGFSVGHMVDSHLKEDYVKHVHKLAKAAGREAHLLYGFCRFAETKQGVYYCVVTPKNDVLSLLANHFSERLMNQAWIIHDKRRAQAAIYDGNSFIITAVPKDATVEYADDEKQIQELWVTFFNTLAIEARRNKKLQRQSLPLYFRGNMVEFK